MITSKLTITREQLTEWVAQLDSDGDCDATDRQLDALIRQSLAALDSDPVAPVTQSEPAGWQFKSVNGDWIGLLGESGKDQAIRKDARSGRYTLSRS